MRGSDDCGQAVCAIDYATLIPPFAGRRSKKPIKNRELGGSSDTCIAGARQRLPTAKSRPKSKTPQRGTRWGVFHFIVLHNSQQSNRP
jgi:hypothetical protein